MQNTYCKQKHIIIMTDGWNFARTGLLADKPGQLELVQAVQFLEQSGTCSLELLRLVLVRILTRGRARV